MKSILSFLGFILWIVLTCTLIIPAFLMLYEIDWGDLGKKLIDGFTS